MSTGARFQFISIDPSDQVRTTSWIHHISRLTGTPVGEAVPASAPIVLWQLAAGNHRVLARSAAAFPTIESAWADIDLVVAARDALAPRMVRLDASRGYGWLLLNGGAPAVTCARWYAMERDRRESLRSARESLERLAADPRRAHDELVVAGGDRE